MNGHLAVNFHYVGMPTMPHPGIHGLETPQFQAILESIGRSHEFVGLNEVIHAVRGEHTLPTHACLVTLDDGLRCQFEYALPVLDALNIPAAFFVISGPRTVGHPVAVHLLHWLRASLSDTVVLVQLQDYAKAHAVDAVLPSRIDPIVASHHYRYDSVEAAQLKYACNYLLPPAFVDSFLASLLPSVGCTGTEFVDRFYMTTEMVQEIGRRQALGSHTANHRALAQLPVNMLLDELRTSKHILELLIGYPISALSYPYGNPNAVNRNVASYAARAGYAAAWTMERARNATVDDPLLFARIDVNDLSTLDGLGVRTRYHQESDLIPVGARRSQATLTPISSDYSDTH